MNNKDNYDNRLAIVSTQYFLMYIFIFKSTLQKIPFFNSPGMRKDPKYFKKKMILERKRKEERERERREFVVPFIYAFTGCFLYVP